MSKRTALEGICVAGFFAAGAALMLDTYRIALIVVMVVSAIGFLLCQPRVQGMVSQLRWWMHRVISPNQAWVKDWFKGSVKLCTVHYVQSLNVPEDNSLNIRATYRCNGGLVALRTIELIVGRKRIQPTPKSPMKLPMAISQEATHDAYFAPPVRRGGKIKASHLRIWTDNGYYDSERFYVNLDTSFERML